jgi:hypothetical protein
MEVRVRYYQTPSGRSPVEEFLLGLPEATRLEIQYAVERNDHRSTRQVARG